MDLILIFCILIISSAVRSFNFNCDLFYNATFDGKVELVKCSAVSLNITNKNDKLVENVTFINYAEGLISEKKPNITFLEIKNQICRYFPMNFDKFYANLKVIFIHNSELAVLGEKDLQPFTELENFRVPGNKLMYLQQNLFQHNKKLNTIGFFNNYIILIHPNIFGHLTKLKIVNLKGNICIDKYFKRNKTEDAFLSFINNSIENYSKHLEAKLKKIVLMLNACLEMSEKTTETEKSSETDAILSVLPENSPEFIENLKNFVLKYFEIFLFASIILLCLLIDVSITLIFIIYKMCRMFPVK